jgi:hypothetical protein
MVKRKRPWVLLIMGALILASAFCSPKDDERALRELVEKAGEIADLYRFKLKVAKVDGNWLVKRASLERFTGMGFSK